MSYHQYSTTILVALISVIAYVFLSGYTISPPLSNPNPYPYPNSNSNSKSNSHRAKPITKPNPNIFNSRHKLWQTKTTPPGSILLAPFPPSPIMITVHLNGVATPLHTLSLASTDEFVDRYAFDSVLTSLIAITLSSTISPTSSTQVLSIEKYCDPGEKKIPLLYNHKYLEENRYQGTTKMTKNENWMPCTLYTREGVAVFDVLGNSWNNKNLASKFRETSVPLTNLNVYLVPAGRNFMFAPFTVGETFDLSHVTNSPDSKLPISLTTLSVSPKVFEVNNFFSLAESDKIIENALTQKSESHKLKRSSTGADGYNTNPTRTSENAFDTHSVVAVDIKKR